MGAFDLNRVPPSAPGSRFNAADVVTARLSPDQLGRIIMGFPVAGITDDPQSPYYQGPGSSIDPMLVLLAQIAKEQRKGNADFRPSTYSFAAYQRQQIFTANPNRAYFILQNPGASDIMILFETGPLTLQDASASTADLVGAQTRALRVVAGGFYEPPVAPRNAITLFTLNGATNGVCIEGNG